MALFHEIASSRDALLLQRIIRVTGMQIVRKRLFRIVERHAVRHRADADTEIATRAVVVNQLRYVTSALRAFGVGQRFHLQSVVAGVLAGNNAEIATGAGILIDAHLFGFGLFE